MGKLWRMDLELYNEAIEHLGKPRNAAKALGVSYALLYLIASGRKGLSLRVAKAIERATRGRYLAADLLGLTTTATCSRAGCLHDETPHPP